jgi:MOSC domain-containing protein YiiM
MTPATLLSVHTGRIAPLGPQGVPSGFVKQARSGAVAVGPTGLDGDEQADLRVHGGPEKAVYGYAASHYAAWRAEFPQQASLFASGGLGENLSIDGLDESRICVGDVHAVGTALLQVCQPRQPCFKLALRAESSAIPKAMVKTGRAGWYYRVIAPGIIQTGDAVTLKERPNADFLFSRLVAIVNHNNATVEELVRLAEMPGLARQWRVRAREALRDTDRFNPGRDFR